MTAHAKQYIVYLFQKDVTGTEFVGPFATLLQAQAWVERSHVTASSIIYYPITAPRYWRVGGTS